MPTPHQQQEHQRRIQIIQRALALRPEHSWPRISAKLAIPMPTLQRWVRAHREGGAAALLPKWDQAGAPAVADCLSPAALDFLKRKRLKSGSTASTLYHFAHDPLCPPELHEKILTMKKIPLSLYKTCHVSPEAEAQYRGPTAQQHISFKGSHDPFIIDPVTDHERPLLAGDIFISDDMSRNIPFWFELAEGEIETRARRGDKLAERHGVAVGRQGLFTMDARGKLLGFTLVGCARDAYTADDVLRHFWNIGQEFGWPRVQWVLEKGVWCSRKIDGTRVQCPDEMRSRIVSGFGQLGFAVEHVHTSEGKALLEGWFNFFQRNQSLQEGAPDIGRKRGEMEREAALMRRVQAGVIHPAEGGLPHYAEAMRLDRQTCIFLNGRQKNGRIQNGVPDTNWARDTEEPNALRKPAREERGHFLSAKLETAVRSGHVEKKIEGDWFRFSLPERFGILGPEYRVLMCFDPTDPEAGAEIYNLETGSRNQQNLRHMEWMGTAEYSVGLPMFGYSNEVAEAGARRKRYQRAFKNAYAGTGIFGRRAATQIESRDGRGQVQRVEIGAQQPEVSVQPDSVSRLTSPILQTFQRPVPGQALPGRSSPSSRHDPDPVATSPGTDAGTSLPRKAIKIRSRLELLHA